MQFQSSMCIFVCLYLASYRYLQQLVSLHRTKNSEKREAALELYAFMLMSRLSEHWHQVHQIKIKDEGEVMAAIQTIIIIKATVRKRQHIEKRKTLFVVLSTSKSRFQICLNFHWWHISNTFSSMSIQYPFFRILLSVYFDGCCCCCWFFFFGKWELDFGTHLHWSEEKINIRSANSIHLQQVIALLHMCT